MKKILLFLCLLISPWLAATTTAEEAFDLQNYKGKVVYVDFWASWCAPCRASFPFMHDIAEKYRDSLVVVAINVDKERKDAEEFMNDFDINFDIVYDPAGSLATSFDVKGMPTSYLYDRQGNLMGSHIGFKNKDINRLEAAIVQVIDSKN